MKMNVEVEGKELMLKNNNGDTVIVPKNMAGWVKQKISEGDNKSIDKFISTLPSLASHAAKGGVYPRVKVMDVDGNMTDYDTSSTEYRDLHKSGKLNSYDPKTGIYSCNVL